MCNFPFKASVGGCRDSEFRTNLSACCMVFQKPPSLGTCWRLSRPDRRIVVIRRVRRRAHYPHFFPVRPPAGAGCLAGGTRTRRPRRVKGAGPRSVSVTYRGNEGEACSLCSEGRASGPGVRISGLSEEQRNYLGGIFAVLVMRSAMASLVVLASWTSAVGSFSTGFVSPRPWKLDGPAGKVHSSRDASAGSSFGERARFRPGQATGAAIWRMQDEDNGQEGGGEVDWREMRARLVAQEQGLKGSSDDGEWVYNAGQNVERGCLLLAGSANRFGFGLRQQHFHKCVMLVISTEAEGTKAVIVNRPSEKRTARGWPVLFGGEVRGFTAPPGDQEWTCVHCLPLPGGSPRWGRAVLGPWRWLSLADAEALVDEGAATPRDFWVFCGFSGWGAGQLQREMDERASWHVAAASAPALGELMRGAAAAWPGEAGVGAWTALVQQMGLRPSPVGHVGHLSDRLPCARGARAAASAGAHAGGARASGGAARGAGRGGGDAARDAAARGAAVALHPEAAVPAQGGAAGAARRGRGHGGGRAQPSHSQLRGFPGRAQRRRRRWRRGGGGGGGGVEEAEPPRARMLGFGGEFEGGGRHRSSPPPPPPPFPTVAPTRVPTVHSLPPSLAVFWLHAHPRLRAMGVGRPVGQRGGVWRCSQDEMLAALAAEPPEADESWFLAVRGFCVWPKGAAALETSARNSWRGLSLQDGGLQADIDGGAFDRLAALPADAWALMLALGEPQAAGAQRDDDAGIRAWEACEKALAQPGAGGAGAVGEGAAGGGAGEEGDAADLEDLADRALREFARCFLALPASSPS